MPILNVANGGFLSYCLLLHFVAKIILKTTNHQPPTTNLLLVAVGDEVVGSAVVRDVDAAAEERRQLHRA